MAGACWNWRMPTPISKVTLFTTSQWSQSCSWEVSPSWDFPSSSYIVIICHHDHPFSPFSVSSLRCPTVCLPITGSWPHFLLRSFVSHSRHSRHNRHCPRFYPVLSKTNVSNVSLPGVQSCHRVMIFLGVCETTPVISERHDLCNERKHRAYRMISEWCLSKEASTSWSYRNHTFKFHLIHEVYTVYTVYQCMYHLYIVYVWTLACNPVNVPKIRSHIVEFHEDFKEQFCCNISDWSWRFSACSWAVLIAWCEHAFSAQQRLDSSVFLKQNITTVG